MDHNRETTDFGFEQVETADKARRVGGVFTSVAGRYDLMNDLLSLGLHRLWKRFTVEMARLRPGETVLDLAGGTGDLTRLMSPRVGPTGRIILADFNQAMLEQGRALLTDKGIVENVRYLQADAQQLPFPDNSFHCITIAFGLRNVTDKAAALASMQRVLRPGGRLLILEFSELNLPPLKPVYDLYSFKLMPKIGSLIAGDADSYRYLAESIRMHPDQETLKQMMITAGFSRCRYHNLSGGIVAVHSGYKR
ncbi:MAG: bifunctional demethylmenaquinone methyltransferase/2-methoxy-6-polyprenyl-1,4-benzoquinol methylase UbiE [Gammaproteobacteria bacterium]|nr:bifunctional demethylmenaquinone methyltransferase/2-methoxy-6-polyprenyl-1,4-benzoquinol methylase UbiE [Gammaproteobacteria bacterium]